MFRRRENICWKSFLPSLGDHFSLWSWYQDRRAFLQEAATEDVPNELLLEAEQTVAVLSTLGDRIHSEKAKGVARGETHPSMSWWFLLKGHGKSLPSGLQFNENIRQKQKQSFQISTYINVFPPTSRCTMMLPKESDPISHFYANRMWHSCWIFMINLQHGELFNK